MKHIVGLLVVLLITNICFAQSTTVTRPVGKLKSSDSKFSSILQYSFRSFSGDRVEFMFPDSLEVSLQIMGLSYQLDKSTRLGLATSYIKNTISLLGGKPSPFAPELPGRVETTEGMSDTYLGVYKTYKLDTYSEVEFALQMSLPTGAHDLKSSSGAYISYPGQLGSGTFDAVPYFKHTLKNKAHKLSYMVQAKFRNGTNSANYTLGNEYRTTIVYDYKIVKWLTASVSAYHKRWGNVKGAQQVAEQQSKARKSSAKVSTGAGRHGAPSGSPRLVKVTDPFALKGSRFSTLVGLKTGIFVSKNLGGIFELAKPVYNTQNGSLEGLDMDWVAKATLIARF